MGDDGDNGDGDTLGMGMEMGMGMGTMETLESSVTLQWLSISIVIIEI